MQIPVIKIDHLKTLLGNDDKLVAQFITLFKSEIPSQIADLEMKISGEEWDHASNIAHAIKSQVRYLGLEDVALLAYRIESDTENLVNLHHVPKTCQALKDVLELVIDRL